MCYHPRIVETGARPVRDGRRVLKYIVAFAARDAYHNTALELAAYYRTIIAALEIDADLLGLFGDEVAYEDRLAARDGFLSPASALDCHTGGHPVAVLAWPHSHQHTAICITLDLGYLIVIRAKNIRLFVD